MRQRIKFVVVIVALLGLAIIVLITASVQANSLTTWIDQAQSTRINAPIGPEADPQLRHVPGGYDYETEAPSNDVR